MWVKYVGNKYPGGVVEDFEHTKFYWGPENDWMCDIPERLVGMILQAKGIETFMPCLAPEPKVVEVPSLKPKIAETPKKEIPQPEKPKVVKREKPTKRGRK